MSTTETIELAPTLGHEAATQFDNGPSSSSQTQTVAFAHTSQRRKSNLQLTLTIFQPSLINFFASFTNGVITVGLPTIARSIHLPRSLYLWPSSVYGLTCGAALLLAGAVCDIVGARSVELFGMLLLGAFTLACGLVDTGVQLVVFRALQGIAMAMHLPASVSIVTAAVPPGRARNVAFACLGFSQPLGFSVGLVLSGIMIERAGWRSGFYLSGSATLVAAIFAFWTLPKVQVAALDRSRSAWSRIWRQIDWIGGFVASGGLAILAYVLAILSTDLTAVQSAKTASLLALSVVLLASFPGWMHYRERAGKPALIPNSLWKNIPFSSVCIMVMLSWGEVNSIEIFSSLYFQEVQNASTLTTSLYLLPQLLTGVMLCLTVGLVVHRIPARWLILCSTLICGVSPLIMALVDPAWQYWYLVFWAQVFAPFSTDVLFTVGLIIVSDTFPEETQGLAGAVFNTVGQFGMTLGVGICQVVALSIIGPGGFAGDGEHGAFEDQDPASVLKGYRASFWTMLGYTALIAVISALGLRKVGKVGMKME